MNPISPSVHEGHLASVLGEESLQRIYQASVGVKIPVPIAGTPFYAVDGRVITEPKRMQDTRGKTLYERPHQREAARPLAWDKGGRTLIPIAGGGFTSLSDLIDEVTNNGKSQVLYFFKGPSGTKVVGRGWSYWGLGSWPAIGAAGGTTGSGVARTSATAGALKMQNATGGDTLHVTTVTAYSNVGSSYLLMYDRLWDMTHTMTVDPRSTDGTAPTRYQGATTAPGNFFSGEVTTVLPAATPTITLLYVDQDGNNVTGPAFSTIASAAAVNSIPFTAQVWAYPLDPADTGIRAMQNNANGINLSAAMASGVVTWFIGHPLVFVPFANVGGVLIDGINSAFNLQRVYDDACLAFLEPLAGVTTTTTVTGFVQMASG